MASTQRTQSNPLLQKAQSRPPQHRSVTGAESTPVAVAPAPSNPPADATPSQIDTSPIPAPRSADDAAARAGPSLLSFGLRILLDILLIGVAVLVLNRPDPPAIALHPPPTPAPTATATALPTPAPITVFVSGAVRNPALYQLPPAARVGEALEMAGGLLPEADPALINQAQLLFDGAQVHVPLLQVTAPAAAPVAQPAAGVSGNAAAGSATAGASGGRININTASADALTALPGIGLSKAENIIAGRPYDSVDDLERVSGIGAKTVEKLRDLVTVQ